MGHETAFTAAGGSLGSRVPRLLVSINALSRRIGSTAVAPQVPYSPPAPELTATQSTSASSRSSLAFARAPTITFTGSPPLKTIRVGIESTP